MIDKDINSVDYRAKMLRCIKKAEHYERQFDEGRANEQEAERRRADREGREANSVIANTRWTSNPIAKSIVGTNQWFIQQAIMYGIAALVTEV